MRASRLIGPRRSELVSVPDPVPDHGDVLVRIEVSGVCASELHRWIEGPAGEPVGLGHEGVGEVIAVGAGVDRWRPGDRVTGLMSPTCAETVLARADRLLPVPAGLVAGAVLGEPLACLVNAIRRTRVELGDRVAIVGLGYMGLGMLELVRLRGTSRVLAIDVRAEAREHALAHGADEARAPDGVDPADLAGRADPERGFDVVVEASGTQAGLDLSGRLVRQHGILSIVGYHQGPARSVDMEAWNFKAIDVVNAHVRRDADRMASMAAALSMVAAGALDLGRLVTHRYPLADLDRAFADLEAKPAGFVKAVVVPDAR